MSAGKNDFGTSLADARPIDSERCGSTEGPVDIVEQFRRCNRTNMPHPRHEGMRVVGFIMPEAVAGLSDGLFMLEKLVGPLVTPPPCDEPNPVLAHTASGASEVTKKSPNVEGLMDDLIRAMGNPISFEEARTRLEQALKDQQAEIASLTAERDDTSQNELKLHRRVQELEGQNAVLEHEAFARKSWLRRAKDEAGYSQNTSFDTVWVETLSKAALVDGLKKALGCIPTRLNSVAWACARIGMSAQLEPCQSHRDDLLEMRDACKQMAQIIEGALTHTKGASTSLQHDKDKSE